MTHDARVVIVSGPSDWPSDSRRQQPQAGSSEYWKESRSPFFTRLVGPPSLSPRPYASAVPVPWIVHVH